MKRDAVAAKTQQAMQPDSAATAHAETLRPTVMMSSWPQGDTAIMPTSAITSMQIDAPFHAAYRELEQRMKAVAEWEGALVHFGRRRGSPKSRSLLVSNRLHQRGDRATPGDGPVRWPKRFLAKLCRHPTRVWPRLAWTAGGIMTAHTNSVRIAAGLSTCPPGRHTLETASVLRLPAQ